MDDKAPQNYCMKYKPTLWNRMGFNTCHANLEDADHPDLAEAYITTNVFTNFDWRDRLRILFSGKIMTAVATKTNIPVDTAISKSIVSVLPPNYPLKKPKEKCNAK